MNRRTFFATIAGLFALPIFGSRLRAKKTPPIPGYHAVVVIWDDPVHVTAGGPISAGEPITVHRGTLPDGTRIEFARPLRFTKERRRL